MPFERLPETVLTLYSELLDQLIRAEVEQLDIPTSGTFVSKEIRGRTYWYLQRVEGARKRQIYLGSESQKLLDWMGSVRQEREQIRPDEKRREDLVRMLVSGGATREGTPFLQVIQVLSDAKLFRLGGMLVGTQAYIAIANLLGVRFPAGYLRTMDVDIAYHPTMEIVLSEEYGRTDLLERLKEQEPSFFAVPALDPRQPSTSFKVRGRDLRVDFLTPGSGEEPVFLPRYGVAATPLRNLDYLLEEPVQAAVLGGSGILVNVPLPARFAMHKLWTRSDRPAHERGKGSKDLQQAQSLLEVIAGDAPREIERAWEATSGRRGMRSAIRDALRELDDTGRRVRHIIETR